MSRNLSLSAINAINSEETDEVFLILLTISHASLATPIRVTSDNVDTVSRGNLFVAYPFELSLPEDSETLSARASLKIDNVDRSIIASIRNMNNSPDILMEIIRAASPDIVEASFPDFKMTNISYDVLTVSGDLTIEDFTAEPYPADRFAPAYFPSLF